MAETWKPSRIEHDVIVIVKEKEAKEGRGLVDEEIIRYVRRSHPEMYSKIEVKDAITILEGQNFLKRTKHSQRVPAIKGRFGGRSDVPAWTHKLETLAVTDKGILYLRALKGASPEGTGIRLYNADEPYAVRRLFEQLFSNAKSEIKIIDNYIGRKTLDYLLMAKGRGVSIKIMTSSSSEKGFDEALSDFRTEYDSDIEIKDKSGIFHGRVIVIDKQAYIIDHSIKDFGSKPSSFTMLEEPAINKAYLELFDSNWAE